MIHYTYIFDETTQIDFEIDVESCSSDETEERYPEWALLEHLKCEDCAVPTGSRKTCPAALSIKPVVDAFNTRLSYEEVELKVEREGVALTTKIPTQNAVRSLIGLLMPLSSCPVLSRLRPMAQMHTPLGTRERTVFRFVGMHLIAQHLRHLEGLEPSWGLDGLSDLLKQLRTVNRYLAERIRQATVEDATVNGLIVLDAMSDSVEISLERGLAKMKRMFEPYLS